MSRYAIYIIIITACFSTNCMDYGPMDEEDFDFGNVTAGQAVFITNEGQYQYGTASLSYYLPGEKHIENEVFARSNGIPLGDVAQSMVILNGIGYIVVNNSGIIFAVDIDTFKVVGTVTGLVSPRYVHFVNSGKAYVTDLYSPKITVFDPSTFTVTGHIDTRGHNSTEQMVQYGKFVYTNCWSNGNTILVIDTETDTVADFITVGMQPVSMVLDSNDKIWAITDGGNESVPGGQTVPALYRIDAATREIERSFEFSLGDSPRHLCLNGNGDALYYINRDVWRMDITAENLPEEPFIHYQETIFYALGVHPASSELYVADAIDYQQPGIIYRYSPEGELIDNFRVGNIPGSFCFR